MRFPFLQIAILAFCSEFASFGQPRHVTLTLDARVPQSPERARVTNELAIAEFETAELVSHSLMKDQSIELVAIKDGLTIPAITIAYSLPTGFPAIEYRNFVVSGPARIRFIAPLGTLPYFATFRITPEAFPPDRTIIAMPGTNQTSITFECSTNLVEWVAATNGVYGPMPEAKFFRIKARPVN